MLIDWTPEGGEFGNASGLDYVATDVYRAIAERFGATVTVGRFPTDIQEAQERKTYDETRRREPFASFTISWDGGTYSGEDADGKGSTRGYSSHSWLDRIGPETVVFDLRTVPGDRIAAFAVRGPMHNPGLPAGKVSTVSVPRDLAAVADDYLRASGGLAATGARVEGQEG